MSSGGGIGQIAKLTGAGQLFDLTIGAQRRQAAAQREQGAISTATQQARDAANLRQQAREERVQRARILAASESQGAGSRTVGATSALGTQVASSQSNVLGQQASVEAINRQSNIISKAQLDQALGKAIISTATTAFNAGGGFDNLFKG
jgi:hypothetical protein